MVFSLSSAMYLFTSFCFLSHSNIWAFVLLNLCNYQVFQYYRVLREIFFFFLESFLQTGFFIWLTHQTIFILLMFKVGSSFWSSICSNKVWVDFSRFPLPQYLTLVLFPSQRKTGDFIEYSVPGTIPPSWCVSWQYSLGLWIVALLQSGDVEIRVPQEISNFCDTSDYTRGPYTRGIYLDYEILWNMEYSVIFFISLSLPKSLSHLILILRVKNNLMNHIYQSSLRMVSNS